MILRNADAPRRAGFAVLIASGALTFGFIDSCDDRLIGATRFVDPCATFLGNCAPGEFEVNAAAVGDYCVDPACTVPGQCALLGMPNQPWPPLGTITELCP